MAHTNLTHRLAQRAPAGPIIRRRFRFIPGITRARDPGWAAAAGEPEASDDEYFNHQRSTGGGGRRARLPRPRPGTPASQTRDLPG